MRAFLILCSVISAAYAAGLGYNYESNNGPALAGGFVGGPVLGGQALAGPSYAGQALSGPSFVAQAIASPSYSAPAPVPEVNKEFFSYTAPENEFNDIGYAGDIANSLKKNLRVIFVKGPQNSGLENAALQLLAKSAVEERTAIYVLNKQADIGDLANKLNSINHRSAYKPEVHFVKYRTPADAEHAKHAIQSQYDNLGGNTSSYNSGVAPVLDFATKPAAPAAHQPIGSVEGAYLPPNKV
ncbi:uncharacterized protein [Bactrocera oleae]|uniref:uncharacterized protein n=1 Tax=Bactrocera oleae TaxID=104688 RepID=UPI00387E629E